MGKNETVNLALNVTAGGGNVVFVGNPASDMAFLRADYWNILRRQLVIHGTWNSSFTGEEDDDWHYALRRAEEGTIVPEMLITHSFSLEALGTRLQMMRDKKKFFVKCMYVTQIA